MSELAARHLIQQGAASILVANRTQSRAEKIAEEFAPELSSHSTTSTSKPTVPTSSSPPPAPRKKSSAAPTASTSSSAAATAPCSSSTSPSHATSTPA